MNISVIVICLSVLLQLAAAFFAVRLLLLPGRRTVGLITLTIILLMTVLRLVSLSRLITGGTAQADLFTEVIAFCISLLLLAGISYLSRLVRSETKMASMLANSKEHYQTLFSQSPDGILLIDIGGHIIEFNEKAHLDLGYTREEFSRLHLSDINSIETPEEIQRRIEDIFKKGNAEFEVQHRTKAGDLRDVHVIAQVVELAGNKVFHTIWRDVTERKLAENALREKENFLQTIIDTAPS